MLLFGWSAVIAYFAVTIALALRAARRTRSLSTYAVGTRDIPAVVVGLSLAAQLTSVATFVVNPGLVYAFGLTALLGYGVAAGTGIMLGLSVMSLRFRRQGARVQALTVPQWIAKRYDAPALGALFAVLSLALVTFATLIVVALALVLGPLLSIPVEAAVAGLLAIVVVTVMVGGATGHAWTNAAQAMVMLVVAIVMIAAGLPLLAPGSLFARLGAIDPNLVGYANPASPYFRTFFEVFVCNFVVGTAIVCQPHVISKALYLREDRDVRRFLLTAIGCGLVFTAVLVTGFWARLSLEAPARIDRAIPTWIGSHFPPPVQVLITIGLLCAGLSTLEGILLALSSIVSIDLFPRIVRSPSDRASLLTGRVALAIFGVVTAALAVWQIEHPTGGTVAIFAQYGVYLVFSTSFVPLACGMFVPSARRADVVLAVLASIAVYFGFAYFQVTRYSNNPAFLATAAIVAAWMVIAASVLMRRGQHAVVPAATMFVLAVASPAFAQAPAGIQEKDARVYGQKIHYLEGGSAGPTVIFLHGLGGDSTQWRFAMAGLPGARVFAIDQIGFGKSDKPIVNYRVQTFVEFLDGFYREAGIEKATLVGNSLGGWIAAAFALQHPDKVDKLVLVDASGYSTARFNLPPPTRENILKLNPSTLGGVREMLNLLFANKQLVNDVTVQAAFAARMSAGDGHTVNALTDSILRGEDFLDGKLGDLEMPTLVVWGKQDALLPVAIADAFVKDIPRARLTVLDNCGHVPHMECFGPFTRTIAEFLK